MAYDGAILVDVHIFAKIENRTGLNALSEIVSGDFDKLLIFGFVFLNNTAFDTIDNESLIENGDRHTDFCAVVFPLQDCLEAGFQNKERVPASGGKTLQSSIMKLSVNSRSPSSSLSHSQ